MPKLTASPTVNEEWVYPDVSVKICIGEDAITVALAKELLGWENETKTVKFGDDYLLVDETKAKVRCFNNTKNRPFNNEWSLTLAQDILNRKWRLNLETIIIGKSGQILSGQHRLIALVLASQLWSVAHKDSPWRKAWKTEPTMESLIAFGGDESDEFTQTLDNVRARTLADTLYTSELFRAWRPRDKKNIVAVTDKAVKLLWERTGMDRNQYASRMTNTEVYEFLNRHLRVLDAVKHICNEDINGSIRKFINPGNAAGLLYLQGASGDSRADYDKKNPPDQSPLEFAEWETALRFWIGFSIAKKFADVKALMTSLNEDGEGKTQEERVGIVVKAWGRFISDQPMTEADVELAHEVTESGDVKFVEFPTLGGIDVGPGGVATEDGDETKSAGL